jgi:tRNA-dihydrouridine synthase A
LRYGVVHRLKLAFPDLTFVINGGLAEMSQIAEQLEHVDGVMVGRAAYQEPWSMASWDRDFFGAPEPQDVTPSREAVEAAMVDYMTRQAHRHDVPWSRVARHMLGLYNGQPGARRWRQVWSDHRLRDRAPSEVFDRATRARRAAVPLGETG